MKLIDLIFENTDDLKKQIMKLISKIDDEATLNQVKSNLVKDKLDQSFDTDHTKQGSEQDRELYSRAIDIFKKVGATTEEQFFISKILKNNKFKIDNSVFKETKEGTFADFVPDTVRNKQMYEDLINKTMNVTKSGSDAIGPGEIALTLIGKNAKQISGKDKGGDVNFDGWGVEIKAGGAIHAYNRGVSIDSLVEKYSKKANLEHNFNFSYKKANPLLDYFKANKADFESFLSELYKVPSSEIPNEAHASLGSSEINNILGSFILRKYLKESKADSILLLKKGTNRYCNITKDFQEVPPGVKFSVNTVRRSQSSREKGKSGNTLAYPDGYTNINF